MKLDTVDPMAMDRQVEAAALAYRRFRKALRSSPADAADEDPFRGLRSVSSRATYQGLLQMPDVGPLREALVRWVAALTLDRVTLEDLSALEVARRADKHVVVRLGAVQMSVNDMVREAVFASHEGRRAAAADSLLDVADDASSNALFWLARRHEASRQLGLGSLMDLEAPLEKPAEIREVARTVIDGTNAAVQALRAPPNAWQESLAHALARDAVEGWPSRLTNRWLHDLFGAKSLIQGLRLPAISLPEARCGASFLLALSRFGSAFSRASARLTAAPFALVDRPFDARAMASGWLFSSLLTSVPFLRKRLGLGHDTARAQARALMATWLAAIRTAAVQAAVASCGDPDEARHVHGDLGTRALGCSLPSELAGVVPRLRPTAPARVAGALLAADTRLRLVGEFDEDWFDNPKAHAFLREIDPTQRVVLNPEELRLGVERLSSFAEEVCG